MADLDDRSRRAADSRLRRVQLWLLLELNRWVLCGVVLASVFVILVGASQLDLAPLRRIVDRKGGLEFLFTAFIGAIITGTSIVVTINQLVLSQELGAVGDQRERMDEAMAFRQTVEDQLDLGVIPPEPAGFLYELVDGSQRRATRLADAVATEHDEDVQARVEAYVTTLSEDAESITDGFENAQFGTFEVIWHALAFNYSLQIFRGRQLQDEHGDDLSVAAETALEELIETLKLFGPAREHFKTLYFQWELINLSRALLYSSIPALTVMALLIMYIDADAVAGTIAGVDTLVWLTSAGFVVGIAPFVIFIVFILRIASVAKRTLAIGPFILWESAREQDLE